MKSEIKNQGKNEIKENLGNPEILEKLYRTDKRIFKASFDEIYSEIENTETGKFWKARLDYENRSESLKAISLSEISIVVAVCIITTFLIKIPELFPNIDSKVGFYYKNAAIIIFLGLTLYTMLINKITDTRKILFTGLVFLVPAVYINLLPSDTKSASVILAYIHLPLLMWFIYGIVFNGYDFRNLYKRIDFVRYNGDLVIVYALIALAGGVLTGITIGLFNSIGLNIEKFYSENIIITGAVAAPVVAAFIIKKYPALVSKTAPLLAGIFSPLVLITLIIFLITILVTGKDPYNDRDFLLIFNIMLLGVMSIIIFSVTESAIIKNQKFNAMILLALSVISIITDLIALSAIFYRLGEFGLTPNRLAVLVSNILVFINLILIMADLFRINFKNREFRLVELTVSKFLPVYLLWIVIVIFGFPVIFGMK